MPLVTVLRRRPPSSPITPAVVAVVFWLVATTSWWFFPPGVEALREFRTWSNRTACQNAVLPGYIFAYSKYAGQLVESKGRTNSNLQDFRHECQLKGGTSKCHICEDVACGSDLQGGLCHLQLQGVSSGDMSTNVPVVTDAAWAVAPGGGTFRKDFGGSAVTHACVFLTGGVCIAPTAGVQQLSDCRVRCFGHGVTPGYPPAVGTALLASHVDVYSGMPAYTVAADSVFDTSKPWTNQVDLWQYPRNCSQLRTQSHGTAQCTYNQPAETATVTKVSPSFNPQGFLFTYAGSGRAGFVDGPAGTAQFFGPRGVAVDENGYVFVADTLNNAIRMVRPDGYVVTVAGQGPGDVHAGWQDGPCTAATFAQPTGVAVKHDTVNGVDVTTVLVADKGNHRIRKITLQLPKAAKNKKSSVTACRVACLTGLCGNNTLSATDAHYKSSPAAGYADGAGLVARFSAPESVAFLARNRGDVFVVADTGNYLIRWVHTATGNTSTLAGTVVPGESTADPTATQQEPLPGCRPPCLRGEQGFNDGTLTTARFFKPVGVARGPNDTVWVTDQNRVRMVTLPPAAHMYNASHVFSIAAQGTVATIAGTTLQGREDGEGPVASFFEPSGIFVSPRDSRAYVADAASCHVRRITDVPQVAQNVTCDATPMDVVRPSGCTSYDQAIDRTGRKVSRVEANIQYNYGPPYDAHTNATMWQQNIDRGKFIKNCVGVPPPDAFDKVFFPSGLNLVVDDHRVAVNEDSEAGMAIYVSCPSNCHVAEATVVVEGTTWYSEWSSICAAAVHHGILNNSTGGVVQIIVERLDYLRVNGTLNANYTGGSTANGVTSASFPGGSLPVYRVFTPLPVAPSVTVVHTVAGAPSGPLESACGRLDAQPPQFGRLNSPQGVAGRTPYLDLNPTAKAGPAGALSDVNYLFIADAASHSIRGLSAVCTMICENGGRCVGPDHCACPSGWGGVDCTTPVCDSGCFFNQVCVAPNTCACKPGFTNFPLCAQAVCQQGMCHNGGTCALPDTCACANGWFDSNCTTPVCSQTCGNGGRCVGPDACACPAEWTGYDCRIPLCKQTCKNGGLCVAPDTCQCPPQYTNYDCSVPTCQQGFFSRNAQGWAPPEDHHIYSSPLLFYPTYKACQVASWCNATNEFECQQQAMKYVPLEVPSGPAYRPITGRKTPPDACVLLELPLDYKLPFELLRSDNSTSGYWRFAPNTPYTSNASNPWGGILQPEDGHTPPYKYLPDRQLAWASLNNVSQGVYVCANGGNCTAPDTCECAKGWIGFDCRTPVCEQGYYHSQQRHYVSGLEIPLEVTYFERYLGNPQFQTDANGQITLAALNNNSYRLHWPYSNPNYTMQIEFYSATDFVVRPVVNITGINYAGPSDWSTGQHKTTIQGGYRCSIRASTNYENISYVWSHPNYYSRYMDYKIQKDGKAYTYWRNFFWPPVTQKSRVLVQHFNNQTYQFTNEGYRMFGIWNVTANTWHYGTCIMEFSRNCSEAPRKQVDLHSGLNNVYVQDTDLAFRPRVFYDDQRVHEHGRWSQIGGECVDQVIHGCFNNGTCVAPNTCRCQGGWVGYSCNIPTCVQTCHHHGVCTGINECTCERGWSGYDCSIPMCAQECQNGGKCVAPDTCKCNQWPNNWVDGRLEGGHPLFQDLHGNPLPTGWTGLDCSVPICTQAEQFLLNTLDPAKVQALGGHGGDGRQPCIFQGKVLPRCPMYDAQLTANDGKSFLSGCGYDPFDTGCCTTGPGAWKPNAPTVSCYRCKTMAYGGIQQAISDNHTFYCLGNPYQTAVDLQTVNIPINEKVYFRNRGFLDKDNNYLQCGQYHQPRYYRPEDVYQHVDDYGTASYYISGLNENVTNYNYKATVTSNRFLCNVMKWVQGDYIDDAGLGDVTGMGSIVGLKKGRHVRINNPNIFYDPVKAIYYYGPPGGPPVEEVPGEGLYQCYHGSSCIAPDICTCTDGYSGFDCRTPLCRHLQPTGIITSCLNGGTCVSKDFCECVQSDSTLYEMHVDSPRGPTGWTGTDCSIPMCVQGHFDPFCTTSPQAPAGEGCYRCANGGNCTAPDVCSCAPGWTGYDCRTPVCEVVADPLTRTQLGTVYEDKVISFETDPCGLEAIYGLRGWEGRKYARGNCTLPNECTCLCKKEYNQKACKKYKQQCDGPWQDNLVAIRNLLIKHGPEYTFGTTWCARGYEGNVDLTDHFTTCHQTIYVPTDTERQSLSAIVASTTLATFFAGLYYFLAARLRRRFLLAKIERRRSRRSSDESITNVRPGVN